MADAPAQPLDSVALLNRLTDLIDVINQGGSGPRRLHLVVEAAAAMTGASGAAFVEYTPAGGHLVAATDALTWALGLPVHVSEPEAATMLAALHGQQTLVGDLPPDVAAHIRGRGIQRIVSAVGSVAGSLVGSLHVCFPDPEGHPDAYQLAVLRFLAATAARVYLGATELPVYPERSNAAASPDREQNRDLFIAMTSHELRTPVTVIRGYADTLVERWDSLDDAARREAVRVVWQRARELARLIDRLLIAATDVVRVGDGSTGLPFDPAQALRDAVGDLSADLRRSLRVKLPDALPAVRGDRASFSTVLAELVTNACKYSPDWVDVELTAGSDAYTVWIRVSDRGVGIRPEHAERAFERFWQLERGDQRQYGGVGLGLYLVRKIVERQKGWVSLRPRDGGGAVAEVRLLRADTGAEAR
jgi:signal transduction histidine kinase